MAVDYTDFYDAQTARQVAVGRRSGMNLVLAEVNLLQIAIDSAAASGAVEVEVTGTSTVSLNGVVITGTPMTLDTGNSFYDAWTDPAKFQDSQHVVAREAMDTVVGYFTRLGYSLRRYRDGTTNKFKWVARW